MTKVIEGSGKPKDEKVAATHGFGGLIASGLQTACIFQRLAVTGVYSNWAIIAASVWPSMNCIA